MPRSVLASPFSGEDSDSTYDPAYIFEPGEIGTFGDDEGFGPAQDNPRKRRGGRRRRSRRRARRNRMPRRRGRVPRQFLVHPPRSWRRKGSRRRRRARRNPVAHRPRLYRSRRGYRAGPRSHFQGVRINRRRRARRNPRRRYRRNPSDRAGRSVAFPRRADFHGWKAWASLAGGFFVPTLFGMGWNRLFDSYLGDKLPAEWADARPYIRDGGRLAVKGVSTVALAWGVGRLTKNSGLGRAFFLGGVIGLALDLVGTIAKHTVGATNPFGKTIVVQGVSNMGKGNQLAMELFGFGSIGEAMTVAKFAGAAKTFGALRVMRGPDGRTGAIVHPQMGVIFKGPMAAVERAYGRIATANMAGLGQLATIEAGPIAPGGQPAYWQGMGQGRSAYWPSPMGQGHSAWWPAQPYAGAPPNPNQGGA